MKVLMQFFSNYDIASWNSVTTRHSFLQSCLSVDSQSIDALTQTYEKQFKKKNTGVLHFLVSLFFYLTSVLFPLLPFYRLFSTTQLPHCNLSHLAFIKCVQIRISSSNTVIHWILPLDIVSHRNVILQHPAVRILDSQVPKCCGHLYVFSFPWSILFCSHSRHKFL